MEIGSGGIRGRFWFWVFERRPGAFPPNHCLSMMRNLLAVQQILKDREKEFFKRFLWNAILQFQILEKKKIQVLGGEGLAVTW